MPRPKSVQKRIRQNAKHHAYNQHYKSRVRTLVKNVMQTTNKSDAEPIYRKAVSTIDKVASKGVIHKNKAAREKSKITKHLNSLAE